METNRGGGRSCGETAAAARPACASCKHQRKRCAEDCFLAEYFPAEKQEEFGAVQRVFGLSNLTKMIRANDTDAARHRAARTLAWEAEWRSRDPADGCFREVAELRRENARLREHVAALVEAVACRVPRRSLAPPPLPPTPRVLLPQFLDHNLLLNGSASMTNNNNSSSNLGGSENLGYFNFGGPLDPVLGAASTMSSSGFVDQGNFLPFDDGVNGGGQGSTFV